MRYLVIDTETTGVDAKTASVVELAGVACGEGGNIVSTYQTLVALEEGESIPPEAKAIHHITEDMLKGAPNLQQAMQAMLFHLNPENEAWSPVAHNAAYDSQVLGMNKTHQWLCTYKLARVAYDDLESYKNQFLRYALLCEPRWEQLLPSEYQGLHAHRALYDAVCTAAILAHLLEKFYKLGKTWEELYWISNNPLVHTKMPWGKYKGKHPSEVPFNYWNWMWTQIGKGEMELDEDMMATLKHYGAR